MLASCLMRRALPEDAEEIAELEMGLFPDTCFNSCTLKRIFEHSPCWVVDNGDDELKGYLLAQVEGDLIDILRVAVREEYRGRSLGFRLMIRAMVLAPRAALMVRKDNKPALRLYFNLGFQIAGEFEDSWMMLTSSCT